LISFNDSGLYLTGSSEEGKPSGREVFMSSATSQPRSAAPPSSRKVASEDEQVGALKMAGQEELESCFKLGAALNIWHRNVLRWRLAILLATVLIGGLALFWEVLLRRGEWPDLSASLLILATAWMIGIYAISSREPDLSEISRAAAQFFNLRDRFRRATQISGLGPVKDFAAEFNRLMDIKEAVRQDTPAVPGRYTRAVQSDKFRLANSRFIDDGTGTAASKTPGLI
jgi:hypothetical protein